MIQFGLPALLLLLPPLQRTLIDGPYLILSSAELTKGRKGEKREVSPDHRSEQALLARDGDGAGIRPGENPENSGKGFGASYD